VTVIGSGMAPPATDDRSPDAVVVGSGPNGLSAGVVLARAGWSVLMVEARATIGGGSRTGELTLPGFRHDICSAVHPLAAGSPFLRSLPLERQGLEWIHPDVPLAHPLDNGRVAVLRRSLDETAESLGADARSYHALMGPVAQSGEALLPHLRSPAGIARNAGPLARHPVALARFTLASLGSVARLARARFEDSPARALLAGMGGHSNLPLTWSPTAGFALGLALGGHVVGWPVAAGGSQAIADALASIFIELGGEIQTETTVTSLDDLPPARAIVLDLTPRQVLQVAGSRLPLRYQRAFQRYRYGPGVFKMDWALDSPIPWRDEVCRAAGTLHLGGTLEEIAAGEAAVWQGNHPERPFLILSQPSLFDRSRAPDGKDTAWAYCHVPNGSSVDMAGRVEAQIERFAPGFRDCILARNIMRTGDVARYNQNYIGGDMAGGVQDLEQAFVRPSLVSSPYWVAGDHIYFCSSATPPGPGVHGMCGYLAARAVLAREGRRRK
jgi:phytoene dehydrogenase-like protein